AGGVDGAGESPGDFLQRGLAGAHQVACQEVGVDDGSPQAAEHLADGALPRGNATDEANQAHGAPPEQGQGVWVDFTDWKTKDFTLSPSSSKNTASPRRG